MLTIPTKGTFLPFTNFKVPPGTKAFQAGYKDGCSSVLYARGNVFYRSRYDYRYDVKMSGNTEYKFGYSKGWGWCFVHIVGISPDNTLGPPDGSLSPYGRQPMFDMSPNNVNNAWGGFFKGGLYAPIDPSASTSGGLDASFSVLQEGVYGGTTFGANPLWSSGNEGVGFMGIW